MKRRESARRTQATPEAWKRFASASGGAGGRQPPRTAAAGGGKDPWRLTKAFNQAAKPQGRASSARVKRQVSELRRQMQQAAQQKRSAKKKQSRPIASKQAIDALRRKLSQPKPTIERTPLGSVTRGVNPQRDRKIREAMKRMETRLRQAKGKAKQDFNRASRKC